MSALLRTVQRVGSRAALRQGASTSRARVFSTSPTIVPDTAEEFTTQDGNFENYRMPRECADNTGRTVHYAMMGGAKMMYASVARLGVIKMVTSLSASADVLALSSTEVDLNKIEEGTSICVKWRGKPVFVRHRTDADIAAAQSDDGAELRDPETDASRTVDPKWMIIVGVCTHLGCVPVAAAGDYGAWFCPCHGSHYDMSGRIRKGPAPLNMEVPTYKIDGMNLTLG